MNNSTTSNILFSELSGYNVYVPSKYDPDGMIHLMSNTDVKVNFVPKIDGSVISEKWSKFVQNPVDINNILWPVDIVDSNDSTGLVFKKRAFPKMEQLKMIMYQPDRLSWEHDNIKKLTANILNVLINIHDGGYAYHAFDLESIYYSEDTCDILFDFSLAMSKCDGDRNTLHPVDNESTKVEFLPPWIDFEDRSQLALCDDYYSIAALIFRLLLGKMPYEGRLMDGQGYIMNEMRDTDPDDHIRMFAHYHANPVFIYDPLDESNHIGDHSNEMRVNERWEKLPQKIKDMFLEVFSKKNITREYPQKVLYTAKEWYDALKNNGVI